MVDVAIAAARGTASQTDEQRGGASSIPRLPRCRNACASCRKNTWRLGFCRRKRGCGCAGSMPVPSLAFLRRCRRGLGCQRAIVLRPLGPAAPRGHGVGAGNAGGKRGRPLPALARTR
jgi:hypothetical protein